MKRVRGVAMKNNTFNRNQFMMTSLDEMISEDSKVRVIDAYVRSLDVKQLGYRVYTNKVGRPAYNPQDLIGLYLYSYMSQVISSRKMEEQSYINIEIMWLLNGAHPDHSTIAAFRSNNAKALTETFHDFTKTCIKLGLIGGTHVAVDGTKIHASNNRKQNFSEKSLKKKIEYIDEKIAEYFETLDRNDKESNDLDTLKKRKEKYENMLEELSNSEETQISATDPDSRLMDNKKGGVDVAYNIQATVDSEHALVVDQYVITAPADQGELPNATARAQEILNKEEITVLADKGYYNGKDLEKCFSLKATPIVARQKTPARKGYFSLDKFTYDEENDSFICPQNAILTRSNRNDVQRVLYTNPSACRSCPCRSKCFKQGGRYDFRRITKDKYFKTYRKADKIFKDNKELFHTRQELSEHVFGSIKKQLSFPQFNVRTKVKVEGEVSLLFLGYNFKRVMNIIGKEELIRYFQEHILLAFYQLKLFLQKNREMSFKIYA